jgi:hypothetical protein
MEEVRDFSFIGLTNDIAEIEACPFSFPTGYNTFSVYANDILCQRSETAIKASYLMVIFENASDPIVTGREELGWWSVQSCETTICALFLSG